LVDQPFRRLEKYPILLKELQRHLIVREIFCVFSPPFFPSNLSLFSFFVCPPDELVSELVFRVLFHHTQEGHTDADDVAKSIDVYKGIVVSVL